MASYFAGAGRLYLKSSDLQSHWVGIGSLQGVTFTFKSDSIYLRGAMQHPIAQGMGPATIDGKADHGTFDGRLISALSGGTVTAGRSIFMDEVKTIAGGSVTATNTTGFEDFGVINASGNPLTYTTDPSPDTADLYYVTSGGVYTFNAGLTGNVNIHYRYTVGTGYKAAIVNRSLGSQTTFRGVFQGEWDNAGTIERGSMEFYSLSVPSWEFTFKNDAFAMQNLTFACGANASGQVFDWHHD